MKQCVCCLEFLPLSRAVIQSVFEHRQLLFGDSFHVPLIWNVMAQQTIEVFVAAAPPAGKQIGKVGLDTKGLIDGLVIRKLFAVVHRQSLHPSSQGLSFASMNRPTKSAGWLSILDSTAKPLMRSNNVTAACL